MVYAIFLAYYPKYFSKGLGEFSKILSQLKHESKLIIVANNPEIVRQNPELEVMLGNNINWEFSGWDTGLQAIENLRADDWLIFCNDTFNQHRHWTSYQSGRFLESFNNLIQDGNCGIAGEVHKIRGGESFSLFGKASHCWISTYLFALSADIILSQEERQLSLSEDRLSKLIYLNEAGESIYGDQVSNNLVKHISEWMDPKGGKGRWYKSQTVDRDTRIRKIKTILNEMYLATICVEAEGRFFNTAAPRIVRALIRIKNSLLTIRRPN